MGFSRKEKFNETEFIFKYVRCIILVIIHKIEEIRFTFLNYFTHYAVPSLKGRILLTWILRTKGCTNEGSLFLW